MRGQIPVRLLVGASALSVLTMACGDGPNIGGPDPPAPTVKAVTIAGPDSVAPGQAAQYTAIVQMIDGTERRVTSTAWTSSNRNVLNIDEHGWATASSTRLGDATIGVNVDVQGGAAARSHREIAVLPPGTFKMAGSIGEADIEHVPVPNVRVEIRASADASAPVLASTTSSDVGSYRLWGVPATGYVHVSRDGYLPIIQPFQIDRHTSLDFRLQISGNPRMQLEGTWTMTVEAQQCSGNSALPTALRRREYTAVITQSGPRLTGVLSDASFASGPEGMSNHFSGVVTPSITEVQMQGFHDPYYYPSYPTMPDIAEMLPDGTVLVVSGRTRLTGTAEQLTGVVGMMAQYSAPTFPSVRWLTGCFQPRITLTRR